MEPEVVGLDIAFCDGANVGGRGFAGKVDLLENGDRSETKIGSGFSARHMELACQKRFEQIDAWAHQPPGESPKT